MSEAKRPPPATPGGDATREPQRIFRVGPEGQQIEVTAEQMKQAVGVSNHQERLAGEDVTTKPPGTT